MLIEEMAVKGAELLLPVFEREGGGRGASRSRRTRSSTATRRGSPSRRSASPRLAPNMQVKMPATHAGIRRVEEATAAGVIVNATVCFTVPQAIAVAEAVERGLRRREEAGRGRLGDVAGLHDDDRPPGRLAEVLADRDGVALTPGDANWAGIACLKKAYGIFQERGYRARLLAAAYRHHLHWSELIGGDIVMTIPYKWQLLFNASDIEVRPRMDDSVPDEIVAELYAKLPDFRRAFDADGMRGRGVRHVRRDARGRCAGSSPPTRSWWR